MHEPTVIDIVARDAAGEYMVVMVEDRPWGSDPSQSMQLRAKLNTYAAFILDGGLVEMYPQTAGQPVRIQLRCASAPTPDIAEIIAIAERHLQPYGVGVVVKAGDHH